MVKVRYVKLHIFKCVIYCETEGVLIKSMFKKKIINASSNLKNDLHLRTKVKLNEWLQKRNRGSSSFFKKETSFNSYIMG